MECLWGGEDLKCCCHLKVSVGLMLSPSPANVTLQLGLRKSWCFPQYFPLCCESSTAPDGFPATTEGSALGWLWHTVLQDARPGAGQGVQHSAGMLQELRIPLPDVQEIHGSTTSCVRPGMAYCTQFPGTHPVYAAGSLVCCPETHPNSRREGKL